MLPFGPTVRRWRLERGLSQDELARRAGLPRPNLSNMERGTGDVSLRTLRALALALNVTPGTLADGHPPDPGAPLSRAALERIAGAAATRKPVADPGEQALADHLFALLRPRLRALGIRLPGPRRLARRSQNAWLTLAAHSPEVAKSLVQRVLEKACLRGRSASLPRRMRVV
jgi:transcriptional regulator with XRE-family HTH domain